MMKLNGFLNRTHQNKEIEMYTFENVIDKTVDAAKHMFVYVPNTDVRKNLEDLAVANGEYFKSIYSVATNLTKVLSEQLKDFDLATVKGK